jgi:hypothetical protein
MKTLYKTALFLALGALCMGIGTPLRAATIFDNSVNDLTYRFNPGTLEVGDQIVLAGTERYLTYFSFEYWGINTTHPTYFDSTTIEARVRFYENTGDLYHGYATPSPTSLYDSDWFPVVSPTERSTFVFTEGVDFSYGGRFIPTDEITWSVQFQGMGTDDTVGVDLYSPPVTGSEVGDFGDYWQNNGTSWTLLTNSVPMDFAARFFANQTIPEPSTVTLSILGG